MTLNSIYCLAHLLLNTTMYLLISDTIEIFTITRFWIEIGNYSLLRRSLEMTKQGI